MTDAAAAASLAGARNAAFALKERLAFSPFLQDDTGLAFRDEQEEEVEFLAAAQEQLHRLAAQRLRDLQLLAPDSPLVRPRRSAQQVARLVSQAGTEELWQAVGMRDSPAVDLPRLPHSARADWLGPNDLLLALAGLLPKDVSHAGPACQPLPRSLGIVTFLPGTQALTGPSAEWLRTFFADLRPQQRQVGVDDREQPWFREVKVHAAAALVQEGCAPLCRSFAKLGVPQSMRAPLWEAALGLGGSTASSSGRGGGLGAGPGAGGADRAPDVQAEALFQRLCGAVVEQPLPLADAAVDADVAASVQDIAHFFLFEDMVRAVLLAFLRDPDVLRHCSAPPSHLLTASSLNPRHPDAACSAHGGSAPAPPVPTSPTGAAGTGASPRGAASGVAAVAAAGGGPAGGARSDGQQGAAPPPQPPPPPCYPPCGVVPVRGLALYVAPLCYLYDRPAQLYRTFRAMYCRYWCKLWSLSTVGLPSPTLPMLCCVFEDLMMELDPQVVSHMHQLGTPVASVAFPWLVSAFVGYLPVEETLLLWDRVVGLDSLLPLPLLAVAVMCFRRQVILACQTASELSEVMGDLSQIRTVPLLQAVLFQA